MPRPDTFPAATVAALLAQSPLHAGIARIALDVWSFNAEARAFFHRHGFIPYIERLWSP